MKRISLNDPRLKKTNEDEYIQSIVELLNESQISPISKQILFDSIVPVAMEDGLWIIDPQSDKKKSIMYLALSVGVIWHPTKSKTDDIDSWKNSFLISESKTTDNASDSEVLEKLGFTPELVQEAFSEINWYCEGFSFSVKVGKTNWRLRFRSRDVVTAKSEIIK